MAYGSQFNPSMDIYGGDIGGLSNCPWASFIDVPRDKQHLYAQMPAMGGWNVKNPATVLSDKTGQVVEVSFAKGKKKVKRVRLKKDEQKIVTQDEAVENPKKMMKYLKQLNLKRDMAWEEKELALNIGREDE